MSLALLPKEGEVTETDQLNQKREKSHERIKREKITWRSYRKLKSYIKEGEGTRRHK